ncbi:MAG: DMT family transporter, partial [Motiliproteus sp.]
MNNLIPLLLPLLFVTVYGSGFVGAKLGLPHSEPFTFLALRFALAGAILLLAALLLKKTKPVHLGWMFLSGLLLQGVFSVGVFYALYSGMTPAVSALIIALQPLLVAVLSAFFLAETVPPKRWFGLFLGLLGVTIVVIDGLATNSITILNLSWALLGLLGLTFGQLLQKRYCADMDLLSGGAFQTLSAALVMGLCGYLFESMSVNWNNEFIIALLWMSIGVSIGALSLLYLMIRQQSSTQVASVFYGVPVAAALVAWPLFGQVPSAVDWLGFAIVALAVVIANHSPA